MSNEPSIRLLAHGDSPSGERESTHTQHDDDPHIYNNYHEYLISIIGFAVGYGSFWRFPYLVYKNGGGVFLIPYFIGLVIVGIPLLYLETAVGQMHRCSVPFIYSKIHRGLKLVGLTFLCSCYHLAGYYNIILAYSYRFMFSAFNFELPFAAETPAENYYMSEVVLSKSDSIDDFEAIDPTLFLLYTVSIVICYFVIKKGVKTSGKIITVTALLPYFFFTILLVRGVFLEGAFSGVLYLFSPKWEKLFSVGIWIDALVQVFFQFTLAMSGLINLASMKPRREPFLNAIYVIPASLVFCGMLCALNIFMYLGHFTTLMGIQIDDLSLSGPELSFNIFPKALAILPFPNLWVLCFFIAMVFLGIDSEFGFLESIFCFIKDCYKEGQVTVLGRQVSEGLMKQILIFSILIFSPTLCSHAGIYYLQFYDRFVTSVPFSLGAVIELYFFVYVFPFEELERRILRYTKETCPAWIRSLLKGRLVASILLINLGLGITSQVFCFWEYTLGFYLFGWAITVYPYVLAFVYYKRHEDEPWHLTFQQLDANERNKEQEMSKISF